jgi:hypothetical protein
MLALFESSAHFQYHPSYAAASINYLDGIIRCLQLTVIDNGNPDVSSDDHSSRNTFPPSIPALARVRRTPNRSAHAHLFPRTSTPQRTTTRQYGHTLSYGIIIGHLAEHTKSVGDCRSVLNIVAGYLSQLVSRIYVY